MTQRSNLEIVREILEQSNEPVTFADLWKKINELKQYPEEEWGKRMSQLYTNMMIDGRFVNVKDNTWDLRDRVKYEEVHRSMYDFYSDEESEDEEDEDDEQENDDEDVTEYRLNLKRKDKNNDDSVDEDDENKDDLE